MAERLDLLDAGEQHVSGRKLKRCEPCKKKNKTTEAIAFCKQCSNYQCGKCVKTHEIFDLLSGHEIVKVDEAGGVTGVTLKPSPLDLKGLNEYDKHNKKYKFFCVDHNALLCSTCVIETHRQCKEINALAIQIKKTKSDVSGLMTSLREAKNHFSIIRERSNKVVEKVNSRIEELPREVDEVKDKVIKLFDDLKTKVTQEAREKGDGILEQENIKQTKCEDIGEGIEHSLELLRNVEDNGSPEQEFIAARAISDQLEKYRAAIKNIPGDTMLCDVKFVLDYDRTLTELMKPGIQLGTLSVIKEDLLTKLTLTKAVDLKKSDQDTRDPWYSGLAFLPDGRLVVIDNFNRKCHVMTECLEKTGEYAFRSEPRYITSISDEDVAVTDNQKAIHILSVSKDNGISLNKTINCSFNVGSICKMNENTLIVRSVNNKEFARMVSLHGEESHLTGLVEKTCYTWGGQCLYLPGQDKLAVTDSDENAVYIYDVKGTKCTIKTVVKHADIVEATGLCAGPYDTLLVCSRKTDSIVQISLDGQVINVTRVDMVIPFALSMNYDGTSIAGSNSYSERKKLHLYSIVQTKTK